MKNLRDVTDVAVVEVAKTVGSFHLLFLSFYWSLMINAVYPGYYT